jgi:predicted MFS family arabinose efflux permease
VRFRLSVLALETFAIGTGSFVFAGLLEGVARDLSISVGAAGNLVTVFAVTYAVRALRTASTSALLGAAPVRIAVQ